MFRRKVYTQQRGAREWIAPLSVSSCAGANRSSLFSQPVLRSSLPVWLLFFMLGSLVSGWAQSSGEWHFIRSDTNPIKWRFGFYSTPPTGLDQVSPHNQTNDWRGVYGTHAALLHRSDGSGAHTGWVLLWDGSVQPVNGGPLAYTPCLLWRYNDSAHGDHVDYGYIRYLRDKYTALDVSQASIFCGGHSFLPDGRLLVTGGTHDLGPGGSVGLDTAYVFNADTALGTP